MKVYILMGGESPLDAYMDRGLALYDCWLMTEAERYDENPTDYWVKGLEVIEEKHEQLTGDVV
jgi:hypothetical protein